MRFLGLPGNGIGPGISEVPIEVLELLNRKPWLGISFEPHGIRLSHHAEDGSTSPEEALETARAADGVILGPVSHLEYPTRQKGGISASDEHVQPITSIH